MHHQKSWIVALALASIVSAGPFFRIAPPHDHKQSKREVLKRQQPSPDETCGIAGAGAGNGYSCGINNVGFCCSQHGWCGGSEGHCGEGCQSEFGACSGDAANDDMTCGPAFGNKRCPVGYCCSQYGYCGTNTDYCREGCQRSFGVCDSTGGGDVSEDGRCGKQNGFTRCPNGECCSDDGYCGTGKVFCESPDCQVGFGFCDADYLPAGTNTSTVARPFIGNVAYARDIYKCSGAPGMVAITYDDGPFIYTNYLLDLLASYDVKATFFITGSNRHKGYIDDESGPYPNILRRMYNEGHQIASHTWSHQDLSSLSEWDRRTEMIKNEMAIRNVIGKIPTYMRPPYSSCGVACMGTMSALGYHIVYFDLDLEDYLNVEPELLVNPERIARETLAASNPDDDNYLSIMHDVHFQTVYNVTGYLLDRIVENGFRAVTAGECLSDPESNWYRDA